MLRNFAPLRSVGIAGLVWQRSGSNVALPNAGNAAAGPPAGKRMMMQDTLSRVNRIERPGLPNTRSHEFVAVPGTVSNFWINCGRGMPLNLPPELPYAPCVSEQYSTAQFSTVTLWQPSM